MHEVLDKLEKQLKKELETIVDKNDMSPTELDNAKKAVCLMKDIQEVKMGKAFENGGGYSEASHRRYNSMRNMDDGSYDMRFMGSYDGGSYRRNGGRRNSYEAGYSGHSIKDRMIDQLERMMDDAGSDYERQEISEEIHRISMEK